MTTKLSAVLSLSLMILAGAWAPACAQESEMPLTFKFVGSYELEKRVKMRDGRPFPVAIAGTVYGVYTDGASVRL